jgi:hypothetical protein
VGITNEITVLQYFKRIREGLLGEGKFSRYLLYAIGEIILITIGLFIAMQLNSIKQNREDASYEMKMLTEVRRALDDDRHYYERLFDRLAALEDAGAQLLPVLGSEGPFPDSLAGNICALGIGIIFQSNYGPYEAIKSSGIDKISDDSVRNAIVEYYDFALPRAEKLISFIIEYGESESKRTLRKFISYHPEGRTDAGRLQLNCLPVNPDIHRDPEFAQLVIDRIRQSDHHAMRLRGILSEQAVLIDLLDRRLGKLPEAADVE